MLDNADSKVSTYNMIIYAKQGTYSQLSLRYAAQHNINGK